MSTDPASHYDSFGLNFCTLRHDTYSHIDPATADLSGKTVLITGSSRGIGRQTALSFARAGASAIVIAARSPLDTLIPELQSAAKAAGRTQPNIIPLQMDVTSYASVAAGAGAVKSALGHIDILILNSGVLEKTLPITEQDPEIWWNTWDVNVKGQYFTLREFLPLLLASPKADKTVVALSSIGATMTGPGFSAYQSSKMALCRIMEFVNAEYGDKGVVAYSIHPGGVFTDMGHNMPEEMHHMLTDTEQLPADTLVWLTKERRDWLAGRYISCVWDMKEFEAKRPQIEKRDLLKFRLAMGHEDPQM